MRNVFSRLICAPLIALLLAAAPAAFAQTTAVGIGTTAPDVSAALDIVSSTKGALLPRVADATALATPATGLLVFQTNAPAGFYYNAGNPAAPDWQQIATAAGAAVAAGNGLTKTGSIIGLGGTLTQATTIATGGFNLGLTGSGNVGIGTTPSQKLDVDGGITARSNGPISNQGAHLQWNRSGGDGETWLLNQQGLGPGGIRFGRVSTSNGTTEWARFDSNGNLGIGTNPSQKLQVAGQVYSSTGGFRFPDNTVQTTAATSAPATTASNGLTKTGNNIALGGPLTGATTIGQAGHNFSLTGGNVGIGTSSPAGLLAVQGSTNGAAVLDQQQPNVTGGTGGSDDWQSFTAGISGNLTQLDLLVSSPTGANGASGTLIIYAGEGTGGAQLTSQAIVYNNVNSTFQQYPLNTPVAVVAGQQYTYRFLAPGATSGFVSVATNNPYAGGRARSSSSWDYCFKTYVAPTVQTNALTALASGSVGIGTTAPAASAVLDVSSTTRGLLPPRMTQTQRDAIGSPAAGLTLYNTTTNKLNTWNGTSWGEPLTTTEQPFQGAAQTFAYTGGPQTYTVPAGVTRLRVDALGAAGGSGTGSIYGNNVGGAGARVQATLSVSPGQVLQVQVGGVGAYSTAINNAVSGGYNGGGMAYVGGAGGGATDVRSSGGTLADRLLVAAGGGGGGYGGTQGGGGGTPTGGNGTNNDPGQGTGATQAAGGTRQGALGTGGSGACCPPVGTPGFYGGGGGGGGYYGGGGGYYGGAGGGSSWVTPTGSSAITLTAGANAGNGSITLTPDVTYAAPALDASNFINVPGDNLGNHTATQNLNLGTHQLVGTTAVNVGSNLNLGTNTLVGNGGSTGLGISSGGNVGLGTTAPNTRLSISPAVIEPKITLWDGGIANAPNHYGFGISGGQLNYHVESSGGNHVFYAGGKNGNGTELLRIQGTGNVGISGEVRVQNPNNRLRRATTPQSTADQFDAGNVGVHITNYEGEEGGFWASSNYAAVYSPGDNDLVKFLDEDNFDGAGTAYDNGAMKARIDGNGQYFQVSDALAKHDITPIADGLRKLISLSGYTYAFNLLPKEVEKGQKPQYAAGVLAQEVERVLPEAVSQQDGHYMVNYAALTPLFIQAIKELKTENDALKARAAATEAAAAADHASLLTLQAQVARLLNEATPARK